jgi:hypothetical protein
MRGNECPVAKDAVQGPAGVEGFLARIVACQEPALVSWLGLVPWVEFKVWFLV